MNPKSKTQISKDLTKRTITIVREFAGPVDRVWNAWTQSELLDQWWAPRPWKAETKTLDFREGGCWLYAMVGPDHAKHWSRVDFKKIDSQKAFLAVASFCDEHGNTNSAFPSMSWKNEFHAAERGTKVTVLISFSTESDIRKIIEMGFEAGFTAALGNLEQYLNT